VKDRLWGVSGVCYGGMGELYDDEVP
jgi:hypothetical protein